MREEVAKAFGRQLAQQELEKVAVSNATKAKLMVGGGLGALGALSVGTGLATKKYIKNKAEQNPDTAGDANERGNVAGTIAGATTAQAAPMAGLMALIHKGSKFAPYSHQPFEGKSWRQIVPGALKEDAMRGAIMGTLMGGALSPAAHISGTLSKDFDPEGDEPPPGALKSLAYPAVGAAAGAVLHPALKHGPTMLRALRAAWQAHKAKTGPIPHVNMGYKGFLP
jgi:hypothetical protein